MDGVLFCNCVEYLKKYVLTMTAFPVPTLADMPYFVLLTWLRAGKPTSVTVVCWYSYPASFINFIVFTDHLCFELLDYLQKHLPGSRCQ